MWPRSQSSSACCSASRAAGSPVIGSGDALQQQNRPVSESVLKRCQLRLLLRSVGLQPQSRSGPERDRKAAHWSLHRACAIALCLMTLPACSALLPKPPEPTPVAVKPAPLQCLDRAMQQCPGLAETSLTTCADAVVLAVDAMTSLASCQDIHAELVRCVNEYRSNQ